MNRLLFICSIASICIVFLAFSNTAIGLAGLGRKRFAVEKQNNV